MNNAHGPCHGSGQRGGAPLRGLVVIGVVIASIICPYSVQAKPSGAYISALVAEARRRRLAFEVEWLRLGHYRSGTFGGYESEADGVGFFLAPNGKEDPEAELEATLRGFVQGDAPTPDERATGSAASATGPSLEHPFCRFPARRLWLTRELQIDWRRLTSRGCPKFDAFLRETRPASVTLVFSSYYLNNPASAFGHTFLRIKKSNSLGLEHQDLLDYGVDYSANVDTKNPLLYAFKGITGMFPGTFRRLPFYYKVREYNDYESRDIWEYELNLKPIELALMVAHIWEVGSTYFDYYYMGENCSYHVLSVLEVANPEVQLLTHLGWPVLPADTVKALYKNPGLVRRVSYRPSNRTAFEHRVRRLSSTERELVLTLASDPHAEFPPGLSEQEKARALDGALDLIDYRHVRELLKDEEGGSLESLTQQALLERRAELLVTSEDASVEPPYREMPHTGHDTARLGLGSGWSESDGAVHSLNLRLALHDLADPVRGYPETAQIEFLPMELWYRAEHPQLKLEELTLVRIFSLNPISAFEHRWSWTVRTGLGRIRDKGCMDCLVGGGELGAGYTFSLWDKALMFWLMPHAELDVPLKSGLADTLRVGLGGVGGVRLRLHDNLIGLASAKWHALPGQEPATVWEGSGTLRFQYAKDFAFEAAGKLGPDDASLLGRSLIYF
ncbi:MAG: DUF4105 domain-containing protein [Polyangiaceae bacterium]|nr:DUF4105 domain-containing protein [Polyangiaceae bacterium]